MRSWFAIALVVGIASPSLAQIRAPKTVHHVRCFIALASLTQSSDETVRGIGMMGSMFFAGQIFGSEPNIDLKSVTRAQVPSMTPATMKALQVECGQEMQNRGKEISAVGEALKQEAIDHPSG